MNDEARSLPPRLLRRFRSPLPRAGPGRSPRLQIQLRYERASGAGRCSDARAFAAELEEPLGYNPVVARAPTQVIVTLAPVGAEFEAKMRQIDAAGRVLWTHVPHRDRSCARVMTTTTVSVRVAIESLGLSPPPPPGAPLSDLSFDVSADTQDLGFGIDLAADALHPPLLVGSFTQTRDLMLPGGPLQTSGVGDLNVFVAKLAAVPIP